jgi:hypothetical protein
MSRRDRDEHEDAIEDALADAERLCAEHGLSASKACSLVARQYGLYAPHLRDAWLASLLRERA